MAMKYVSLEEAAKMLGKSVDELVDLRSRGEIFGYRDGASWKFKVDEVHRVADEHGWILQGDSAPLDSAIGSAAHLHDPPLDPEDEESVLVTDGPAKDSDSSSTIIGKKDQIILESDLDVTNAASGSDELVLTTEGSDVNIVGSDDDLKLSITSDTGSDVEEDSGDSQSDELILATEGSDVHLIADEESELQLVADGVSGELPDLGDDSEPELELSAPSGTGDVSSDGLELESGNLLGSELDLESELALSDDDDLVLGDVEESDITMGASDTGINLTRPSDSGLSLEGDDADISSSISSLELPEDVVALDDMDADPDSATQLKQDDFLLSPTGEAADELEDSGSQVIAIEDSSAFDGDLGVTDAQQLVEDEGPAYKPVMAPVGYDAGDMVPDIKFSSFDMMLLVPSLIFMIVGTMLMVNVIRNIWSWDGMSYTGSSLMEGIISAFNWKE